MKKILLFLMAVGAFVVVNAQSLPCPIDYKINNGGGNCPDLNGVSATGTVTLTFDGTIAPNNIPAIDKAQFQSNNSWNDVTGITFGPGELNNNGTVTYCYYLGPNNNNNLLGHNTKYRFFVFYVVNGIHVPCGQQSTLPVNFKSFTATRIQTNVTVRWETVTEQNNSGFAIDRKTSSGWQQVTFVPTQAIDGNSTSSLAYQYSDPNAYKGISQYRVRQIDLDGMARISDVRSVRGEGQKASIIVYPNPSSDGRVNVVFEGLGKRNITVQDMSGRIVKEWKNYANNNIQIENLTPGFYTIKIVDVETGLTDVEKAVVNNR